MGQYIAAQNVAKYARNSIHDSPELKLNVIRTALDLATSLTESEARPLYVKIERMIRELENEFGKQLQSPLDVVKIRLMTVQQNKRDADKLLKEKVKVQATGSIEETLDKVKAFHELGHREQSLKLLEEVKKQIGGDSWSSRVVTEYVDQEQIERKEIHFTAKELGEMAKAHFKEKRYKPAYTNLKQAVKLSPNNPQLSMSLLRLLTAMVEKGNEKMDDEKKAIALECAGVLMTNDLENETKNKLTHFALVLEIDIDSLREE
jgi:tetratricopeptide (TPR) repeat protein